jgi:membrane-associated phospholipid phosphatase
MTQRQIDAGTRHYNHCETAAAPLPMLIVQDSSRLPRWRYIIRQSLLPLVRLETPPLARLQQLMRSPLLDSYFAVVANLGTHTFFMIFLPVLFWCDHEKFGRALVNLLALGVIVSGIIKDLLCLPRPVSPPLQRITMSGSVALEYGFPSTHSTNAVSVALYIIHAMSASGAAPSGWWAFVCYLYAFSISFGRLYCGMHGFLDVIAGSLLGALLTVAQLKVGEPLNDWLLDGSVIRPLIIASVLLFIVRTHPEPADNCPCFDDSVAFAGVLIGMNWSYWHVVQPHSLLRILPFVAADRKSLTLGVPLTSWKTLLRIPIGVAIIVAYRAITKPLLLRALPPLFRVIEDLDLDLPRRFFLKASQYTRVPSLRRDDNVLPSPSDVGQMIGDVKRRRGRAVSIGPQSVADAYEMLAYREEVKRHRRTSSAATTDLDDREPTDEKPKSTLTNEKAAAAANGTADVEAGGGEEDDALERRALFSTLPHIRMRYDVEVVTKLIVYCGIAWWAAEGCAVVFEVLGLGP